MTLDPLSTYTSQLRAAVEDVGDVGAVPPRREEAIAALEAALRERQRARKRRRVYATLAVAAGAVAIVGGGALAARAFGWTGGRTDGTSADARELGRMRDPGGAVAVRAGHVESLDPGARVSEGTELRTAPGAEAHLDFDTGTQVTLGGGSRVRLVEQSKRKRFGLESGSFYAHVAKLAPDERFVVTTADAEIVVHGTAFRVSVVAPDPACAGGAATRLEVTEGVVTLRRAGEELAVRAGERWPSCAPPSGASAAAAPQPSSVAVVATANANAPTRRAPAPADEKSVSAAAATSTSSSTLLEQNALFLEGRRARLEGRPSAAVAAFDRLLVTYPRGPLAEASTVERMRALASGDHARGVAAAREYLARYPSGYARAEAEALAAEAP